MASVDRADYMDNIKVAEVEQTIQKEKECVFASSGGLPVFTSGSTQLRRKMMLIEIRETISVL